MNKHINTMAEVEEFFSYLINIRDINIHPDDDFADYVKVGTDEPSLTKEEADKFNDMMEEAFDTCEANGKDIYDIAYNILMARLNKRCHWQYDNLGKVREQARELLKAKLDAKGGEVEFEDDDYRLLLTDQEIVAIELDGVYGMTATTKDGIAIEVADLSTDDILYLATTIQ